MHITNELLDKYNVPVPRYTSYPPATEFTESLTDRGYRAMLNESNRKSPRHIALYVHVPFCRQICYYCGCNATPLGREAAVAPYFAALKREIEMVFSELHGERLVSQVHFGGGTPNAVDPTLLGEILAMFRASFRFIENPEIAIECHPAWLDEDQLEKLLRYGFNRFSLGVQDFDPAVLRTVNRAPSLLPVEHLVGMIRQGGAGVNLDFIYGLPHQTTASFTDTIRRASELRPDRLVTFSYAHVPWVKKHQVILEKSGLPSPEAKSEMFMAAHDLLVAEGYRFIGLDHYVLPEDELAVAVENHTLHRNFQGYCSRRTTGQVYAFGVSAISQLESGYVQNTRDLKEYIRVAGSGLLPAERGLRITPEQKVAREVINEIMCNRHLAWSDISRRTGVPVPQLTGRFTGNSSALDELVSDGIIEILSDGINVSEAGSFFIRNVAAALDPEYAAGNRRFSRAV